MIYTKTWGLREPQKVLSLWGEFRRQGIPTASYHLDLYLGLRRGTGFDSDPFWQTEFVFTPDGDPGSAEEFKRLGVNHHYMKPGVFRAECVPGQFNPRMAHEVVFVGSYPYPHPEWPYRDELVGWLGKTYGTWFRRYGGRNGTVRGAALDNLYASSKVIVGDTLCLGFSHEGYWSDRVYETLGRGGFLVMPYVKGMDEEFVDGEHLRFYDFGDFEHLRQIIDYYVRNPAEGRKIADAGQKFVREHCTYHNRLRQALGVLGVQPPGLEG